MLVLNKLLGTAIARILALIHYNQLVVWGRGGNAGDEAGDNAGYQRKFDLIVGKGGVG